MDDTTAMLTCVITMAITIAIIVALTQRTRDRINAREHAERAEQRATECHHIWDNWKTIKQGPIVHERGGVPYGQFIRQVRTCTMCNKIELDTHETTI